MELEHRVALLEREITILKLDIRGTLLDVQECLSEKPPSSLRWRKKAWALALLNILLAITLFTNIRLYASGPLLESDSLEQNWQRAFWVALAFVWLVFQIYPLALLLGRDDTRTRKGVWRNVIALLFSSPGLTIALTALALSAAAIGVLFPSLWFVIVAALFTVACVNVARHKLRLYQERKTTGKNDGEGANLSAGRGPTSTLTKQQQSGSSPH